MMLGGVGFQAGLDEAHRKHIEEQRKASEPDVIKQIEDLKVLHDTGALTAAEYQQAKRMLLGD